jgi:hypothetical protein
MTKKTTLLTATIIFAIIGLITSTFSYSNASTEPSTFYVPSWVQNVAGFWSNGDVSDDEFVNAMTFLVDEGIMDLPNVVSSAEAQTITSSLEDMNQRLEKIETQTKTAGETSAPTPLSEDELTSSNDICPASKVQHWNKIIFTYFGTLESDKGFPDIIKERTYEIIVQGHPGEIIDLNQLVFDRLTGMGYIGYMPDPNAIKIVDVGYGIICAYDSNPSIPSDKK